MSENHLEKDMEALNKRAENDADIMEEIIEQLGGFGNYQWLLCFMMMPLGLIFAFVYCTQMFVTATPQQHWCRVPELSHLDVKLRRNLSIPGASHGRDWDRCAMYDANWTQVLATLSPPDPNTTIVPCLNGWEFMFEDIPYSTVVSEREWVCDRASFGPIAQMVFFIGSLFGCGFFGWMGDRFGRVPALIGSNLIGFVGGIASIYTVGLWDFVFCRFLVGAANDTCFMMIYILALEYVDSRYRSIVGNLPFAIFIALGGVLTPGLAYWLKDWRLFLIVTSLPMLLVLGAPWAVPESASWLISKGKTNRAVKTLKKFERVNRRKISEDLMQKFITSGNKKSPTDESMTALVKSAPLRNSLILLIAITMIIYLMIDVIMRMSESIGPNFFLTFALSCMAETPALITVAFALDRVGRRAMLAVTVLTAGVLSFICAFVPQGTPQLTVAVLVRFTINMPIGVGTQLGTEMLPTGVRATGNSIVHITAYMATALSPFVVYSGRLWRLLPLIIVGALGLMAGVASLLLPETKGKHMPQTIADAEKLIRENMLWRKPDNEKKMEDLQLKHLNP